VLPAFVLLGSPFSAAQGAEDKQAKQHDTNTTKPRETPPKNTKRWKTQALAKVFDTARFVYCIACPESQPNAKTWEDSS
jgi:hypothetical protein